MDVLNLLENYVAGFSRKEAEEICNSIFVIETKYNHEIFPFKFREDGRLGVSSGEIYKILRFIGTETSVSEDFQDNLPYKLGKFMSNYSGEELKLMALYLWNHGRSALYPDERTKAKELVEKLDSECVNLHI